MSAGGEFRARVRAWLNSPAAHSPAPRLLVIDSGHIGAGQVIDSFLIVRGDLSCGPGCTFRGPLFVSGDCEIDKGSRLGAVAADGRVSLGSETEVADWVDCGGLLSLGAGTRLGEAVFSETAIHVAENVEARALHAPEVVTHAGVGAPGAARPAGIVELLPPGYERNPPVLAHAMPGCWRALDRDTWSYCGDLFPERPVLVRANLFIEGMFSCPAGSMLEGEVHSTSSVRVEANALVRGSLTAHSDLVLGAGTVFQSKLRAGRNLWLGSGVRGLNADGPVEVCAGERIEIEGSVVVRGSLVSAGVVAVKRAEPLPYLSVERVRYPTTA